MSEVYLRMRISPKTFKAGTDALTQTANTAMNLYGLSNGLKVKKMIERQASIQNKIQAGQNAAQVINGVGEIVGKLASIRRR